MLNMALQLCGHEFHQHGVVLINGIAEGVQIRCGVSLLINTVIRGVNAIKETVVSFRILRFTKAVLASWKDCRRSSRVE